MHTAGDNFVLREMTRKWRSRIFHEPCDDGRQRSLFPLPTLKGSGDITGQVCSSVTKRLHRREHIRQRVNMAIDAMNSLFYGKRVPQGGEVASLSELPLGQRECLKSLVQRVSAFGPPPPAASRSRALQALRASSGGYCEPEAGVGDVVSMELSQLSLPTGLVAGVPLESSLEEPLKEMVRNFEDWMLLDSGAWGAICDEAHKIKPYDDPSLSDRQTYLDFLHHLYKCGILGTTSCCRGRVGAFCVSKKPKTVDGKLQLRQRLILDCRQVNLQFREPPHCELGALSAVTELVLDPSDTLFVSGSDIQDCFYAAKISSEMANFFCLLSDISGDEARLVFGDSFQETPGNRISPCITVLPMGFSWSFYLIQKLHEQSALRALQCNRDMLVLDGYPAPQLSGCSAAAMPYCDNVHSLSLDQESCRKGKRDMCNDLTGMGFTLHEDVEACDYFPTLGGIIDGKNGIVKPTPTRAWNIILAFESLLEGDVDWVVLRRLLGHAMTICTINRNGMSIFRSLYDFVEAAPKPRRLNGKERREVLNFVGLVPLLVGELKRPWSTTISCSDASPEGYGVCQRQLDKQCVHELGSWQDRWRFRHLEPGLWRPRERAQGLDSLGDFRTARVFKNEETVEDLYEYNNFFPEVPFGVTDAQHWKTKLMGMWSDTSDHITVKEGRSLVLAIKRLCRSSSSRGLRHLILVDSFSLSSKGRASSFKLLRCLQQISALCMAGGFSVRVRWVPSERNVADAPSRGQINPGAYQAQWPPADKSIQTQAHGEARAEPSRQVLWPNPACAQQSESVQTSPEAEASLATFEGDEGCLLETTEGDWSGQGSARGCEDSGKPKWPHHSGTEVSFSSHRDAVRRLLPEVFEFLQGRRAGTSSQRLHRHAHGRVHGPDVLGRKGRQRGRESASKRRVLPLPVEGQDGTLTKGVERVEKRSSPRKPDSNTHAAGIRHVNADGSPRSQKHGAETHSRFRHLHEARGVHRSQSEICDTSGQRRGSTIPVAYHCGSPFRRQTSRQNRSLRQQHTTGFKSENVDRSFAAADGKEQTEQRVSPVRLHLRGVPQEFATVGVMLGVPSLHPYQLRHGGAAEDLNGGQRGHQGVKARGRWQTDASVRRYTKVGKIQQLMNQLLPGGLAFCQWSHRNLERVMKGLVPSKGFGVPKSVRM